MRKLITAYTDDNNQVTVDPRTIAIKADRIYILAAEHLTMLGFASKSFLEQMTEQPVELGIASEWGYNMPLLSKKPLFIMISQSGETADSRQVLVKANQMGIPKVCYYKRSRFNICREATYTMLCMQDLKLQLLQQKHDSLLRH